MATIKHGNWVCKKPPFADGDVVEGGNFHQLLPNTAICAAVTNLTIHGGNFVNCLPQPTWTIDGGNWAQIEFCSHGRPDLIPRGLPACPEVCIHRSPAKVERTVEEKEYHEKMEEARDFRPRGRSASSARSSRSRV